MSNVQVCAGCLNPGKAQSHVPTGKFEDIGGVSCYVSGDLKSGSHVLVYVTDVFGNEFINHKQAADWYAKNGFTVVVPNMFNDALDGQDPNSLNNFMSWLERNPVARSTGIIQTVANELNTKYTNFTSVQAIGFCYGCRMVVDLVRGGLVKAAIVCHPTFLSVDDVAPVAATNIPMLFNCAETDSLFTPDVREKFEEGLKNVKGTKFIEYPGTQHGFSARPTDLQAEEQRKVAHVNALAFFNQNK